MSFIRQISLATRLSDWRFSFVPFILGCVYLWLWWFKIPFTGSGVLLLLMSLATTAGFASLGYLINELFDIRSDLIAGKGNRLVGLPVTRIIALFMVSLSLTLLPWIFLPADRVSVILICAEIGAFLIYSLPFPRLKAVPVISNLLDAAYAYVLPLALSFHTFELFQNTASDYNPILVYTLLVVVALIGFRNILIHQVDDVFNDKRSGHRTVPMLLGPVNTTYAIAGILALEIAITFIWIILMCNWSYLFIGWGIIYLCLLAVRLIRTPESFQLHFFAITPYRHLTDHIHQIAFPFFTIIMAVTFDWRWLCILPFHLLLVLPPIIVSPIKNRVSHVLSVFPHYFQQGVIYPSTLVVNYSIFFSFLLIGINLKARKQSAWEVISGFFKSKKR